MNQQLVEQYVAGKMSEAEAAAFEEFCLENPEFAKQVELEQRLKAGLAQVARGSTSEFVRSHDTGRWKIALAASVLLFVGAGALLWQRSSERPHVLAALTGEPEAAGATLRLALVRGADSTPQLPEGRVRVQIVGLFDTDSRYSVVLDRPRSTRGSDTVAALFDQRPTSSVSLEFQLDGDQLAPGAYSLHVLKNDSREEPLNFGFIKP